MIKVGGAITSSRGNAHATSKVYSTAAGQKVPCTVPCNAPATFYATLRDTYGGKPATQQYDQLLDRDNKSIIHYAKKQTKVSLRSVILRICVSPHLY